MKRAKRFFGFGLSIMIAAFALIMLNDLLAKHKNIGSAATCRSLLAKNNLVVSLFYVQEKKMPRDFRNQIKSLYSMFRKMSSVYRYKYAEVLFMSINVAKKNLAEIVKEYKLPEPTDKNPVFVLFKGAQVVTSEQGFLSREDIEKLIDKNFDKEMKEVEKEKDLQRKRRLEDARRRAYDRAYWWGSDWPYDGYYGWPYNRYYYYRPYYYRPGFGVHFGFGGRGGCSRCR